MVGRIVTIDGYVDVKHKVFEGRKILNYELINNNWEKSAKYNSLNPHGTAIAGIISKETSANIEIINFDIYRENTIERYELLISALKYIEANIECDVINLSLGMRENNTELHNICKKIYDKGVFVVSAFDNAGAISYPAAYKFVLGVDVSPRIKRKNDFVWVENGKVNIRAMGGLQRVAWNDGKYTINQGSSFAAPHISAILMGYIENKIVDIENEFKKNAIYVYEKENDICMESTYDDEGICQVALFPFNKEMHALVNSTSQFKYEIVKVYDYKYSSYIGKRVGEFEQYVVENIDDCDWNSFDTMIIGHLYELEMLIREKIKTRLIEKCLLHKKNIYVYDDNEIEQDIIDKFEKANLKIYVQATKIKTNHNKFGKLYSISSPVIGVFGTGKRQGKYTIQLLLRRKLIEKGYVVGQLATEPNGLLFGIDEIYPIGYFGINNRNQYEIIEDINYLMHNIDRKYPDIIIVGSQSGTISKAFNNVAQFPLQQMAFLMGCNPDAVILNVNLDDEVDYIKRTIKAIEGIGRGKVIAIVIFPCCYKNGWGIIRDKKEKVTDKKVLEKRRKYIEKETSVKSYILGFEEQEELLIDNCICFFSGD